MFLFSLYILTRHYYCAVLALEKEMGLLHGKIKPDTQRAKPNEAFSATFCKNTKHVSTLDMEIWHDVFAIIRHCFSKHCTYEKDWFFRTLPVSYDEERKLFLSLSTKVDVLYCISKFSAMVLKDLQ